MEKRKKVIGVIRNMKVGDVEVFPIVQSDSVKVTVYTKLLPERISGKKWTIKTNLQDKTIEVTRME